MPGSPDNPAGVWSLAVRHGDDLGRADFDALQTIRRTLLGLMGHGLIAELNTYSDHDMTEWSFRPGTEDPDGIMAGLLDTVRAIGPGDWVIMRPTP
jgi:hypothetical protein